MVIDVLGSMREYFHIDSSSSENQTMSKKDANKIEIV